MTDKPAMLPREVQNLDEIPADHRALYVDVGDRFVLRLDRETGEVAAPPPPKADPARPPEHLAGNPDERLAWAFAHQDPDDEARKRAVLEKAQQREAHGAALRAHVDEMTRRNTR